ncbi:hypothetical protein DPMN_157715 [Dreissena polymorpha]|uniref:Uncharacterized protein n=1 Tax=Dreissena polymorpha TaxID=45954 RepID=A0A9D4EJZ4_DREPO|nr:hypothetical protein DPMN_157715 [Dreissena polymorpha]
MERIDCSRSNVTKKGCSDLKCCPQTERGRRRSRGQTPGEQSDIADSADPQQYVQVSRRRPKQTHGWSRALTGVVHNRKRQLMTLNTLTNHCPGHQQG